MHFKACLIHLPSSSGNNRLQYESMLFVWIGKDALLSSLNSLFEVVACH